MPTSSISMGLHDNQQMTMKKKIFILLACLLSMLTIKAQQIRLGFEAGVQSSRPKDLHSVYGFRMGALGEQTFSIAENSGFVNAGLLFLSKGWKDEILNLSNGETIEWKCRLYYLEVPVHIGYKYALSANTKLLVSAGPYIAVGLNGKNTFDTDYPSDHDSVVYEGNVFSEDMYKRFDFGLGGRIGLEANGHLQMVLGYEHSMTNPTKGIIKTLSAKDRTLSLSLVYYL